MSDKDLKTLPLESQHAEASPSSAGETCSCHFLPAEPTITVEKCIAATEATLVDGEESQSSSTLTEKALPDIPTADPKTPELETIAANMAPTPRALLAQADSSSKVGSLDGQKELMKEGFKTSVAPTSPALSEKALREKPTIVSEGKLSNTAEEHLLEAKDNNTDANLPSKFSKSSTPDVETENAPEVPPKSPISPEMVHKPLPARPPNISTSPPLRQGDSRHHTSLDFLSFLESAEGVETAPTAVENLHPVDESKLTKRICVNEDDRVEELRKQGYTFAPLPADDDGSEEKTTEEKVTMQPGKDKPQDKTEEKRPEQENVQVAGETPPPVPEKTLPDVKNPGNQEGEAAGNASRPGQEKTNDGEDNGQVATSWWKKWVGDTKQLVKK